MSTYNIEMNMLNSSNGYDVLYPKTDYNQLINKPTINSISYEDYIVKPTEVGIYSNLIDGTSLSGLMQSGNLTNCSVNIRRFSYIKLSYIMIRLEFANTTTLTKGTQYFIKVKLEIYDYFTQAIGFSIPKQGTDSQVNSIIISNITCGYDYNGLFISCTANKNTLEKNIDILTFGWYGFLS